MASYEITAVNTEPSSTGGYHEHIAEVKLSDGTTWSRAVVIDDIRYRGHSFYTYGGGAYADVTVAGCPSCTFGEYITTEPDYTTENNLLSLPRF